ncbi:hypothetical protein ABEO76_21895 [Bacillus anthracis]|uniref:hypothetical protein n=1 Tax=Bacillus anthracis TaxID=1392 RepID=UPI003D1A3B65
MFECVECNKSLEAMAYAEIDDIKICLPCYSEGIPQAPRRSDFDWERKSKERKEAIRNRNVELLRKYG